VSRGLYRLFLHCYPAAFRLRFGRDMEETFDQDLADAKNRGSLAVAGLWARALVQAVLLGVEGRFTASVTPDGPPELFGSRSYMSAEEQSGMSKRRHRVDREDPNREEPSPATVAFRPALTALRPTYVLHCF
jgi:hypothetical protein